MADDDQNPKTRPVGYKSPPVDTQFQPGVSGNPKGRPKSNPATNRLLSRRKLLEIVAEEANRTVAVSEGGRRLQMTHARAFIRQIGNLAMKDPRIASRYVSLVLEAEKITPEQRLYDLSALTLSEAEQLHALLLKCTVIE